MSLFSVKKVFKTSGKPKIQIIVDEIEEFDEDGYTIASGAYLSDNNESNGGYSFTIRGSASSVWINEQEIDQQLRLSVEIDSAGSCSRVEGGIIGDAVYESERYVEIKLNVEPLFARDILYELRRSSKRGIRIDGYSISEKVFRVVYFRLSPAKN